FSADISGDKTGLMYSYAWSWEGQWGDNWSSTKLETGGMTTQESGSFTANKTGTYHVWIDVEDAQGNSATTDRAYVTVNEKPLPWTLNGVTVLTPDALAGDNVHFAADISGDKTGLKYNYAWSWEGQWGDLWSSTKKETGSMTVKESSFFKATLPGTYHLWVDVEDAEGNSVTSEKTYFTVKVKPEYVGTWNAVTIYSEELGLHQMAEVGLTATIDISEKGIFVMWGSLFDDLVFTDILIPYDGAYAIYGDDGDLRFTIKIQSGQLIFDVVGGDPSQRFTLACDKV
ncbi:MAG: hypothetical protein IJH83_04075, partial [Coriobacteriales bacterium]|nr:hypothetical protein [Coriobacteriales bacterium]